jgi:hypothetical protein
MPATLLGRTAGTVFVTDNMFSLGDPEDPNSPLYNPGTLPTPDVTGLLAAAPGFVAVTCGVHVGNVSVTVELWDDPPSRDLASWDDVAEVSVTWPAERIMVSGETTDTGPDFSIVLPAAPAASFRVRDSVRNRDAGEDRSDRDPVEQHLIQIWPAAPAADELLKAADQTGLIWRISER